MVVVRLRGHEVTHVGAAAQLIRGHGGTEISARLAAGDSRRGAVHLVARAVLLARIGERARASARSAPAGTCNARRPAVRRASAARGAARAATGSITRAAPQAQPSNAQSSAQKQSFHDAVPGAWRATRRPSAAPMLSRSVARRKKQLSREEHGFEGYAECFGLLGLRRELRTRQSSTAYHQTGRGVTARADCPRQGRPGGVRVWRHGANRLT